MNTTENNKLIAEFMGLSLYRNNWYKSTIATEKKICKENGLLYPSDWNWLMEVVEKCCNTLIENKEATKFYKMIIKALSNLDKTGVYDYCVEFIKWYNKQK